MARRQGENKSLYSRSVNAYKRLLVCEALDDRTDANGFTLMRAAAEDLGIPRSQLYMLMKRHNISVKGKRGRPQQTSTITRVRKYFADITACW